jgi:adenosylmethionine-8-amino-7-oxononanoate aminotransferase
VERGVFIRPFGAIIYLTPAFTIGPQELSRLTGAIVEIVGEGIGGS